MTNAKFGQPKLTVCALGLRGPAEFGLRELEVGRKFGILGMDALNRVSNLFEQPRNRVRWVDRYLLGHLDDEWFRSEESREYLLLRMARTRFNRFCLILGFDTAAALVDGRSGPLRRAAPGRGQRLQRVLLRRPEGSARGGAGN